MQRRLTQWRQVVPSPTIGGALTALRGFPRKSNLSHTDTSLDGNLFDPRGALVSGVVAFR